MAQGMKQCDRQPGFEQAIAQLQQVRDQSTFGELAGFVCLAHGGDLASVAAACESAGGGFDWMRID